MNINDLCSRLKAEEQAEWKRDPYGMLRCYFKHQSIQRAHARKLNRPAVTLKSVYPLEFTPF